MPLPSVLVIDDEPLVHELVSFALRERARPLHAHDPGVGLEMAAAHRPDVTLLDIDMPGLDGLHVCKALKADPATRDIPVLFMTANDSASVLLRSLGTGAVDFIAKPFDPRELITRVIAALDCEAPSTAWIERVQAMLQTPVAQTT